MPAGAIRTPNDARTIEAGMLLIGAGAILLFVSLFLEWYQPGIDAWEIFEVWDLVLAVLAIAALVAVASRLGFGPPRPSSWLIGPALAALVIVLYLIINPPPLTPDIDGDPSTGLWLALAAAVLMTAGALLSVARISVAFTPGDTVGRGHDAGVGRGGRFGRGGAGSVAGDPADPGVAGPARAASGGPAGRRRRPSPRAASEAAPSPVPSPESEGAGPAAARVVTIGVYEFDLPSFLGALRTHGVGLVLDVRQRRGVRGARYAWANSRRLQAALAGAGIAYSHHRELAPTTELRHLQYAADDGNRVGKRSRAVLDPAYVEGYVREILERADLDALVAELPAGAAAALLCVEADPEACHRSLIAGRLAERHGLTVAHVRPAAAAPISARR